MTFPGSSMRGQCATRCGQRNCACSAGSLVELGLVQSSVIRSSPKMVVLSCILWLHHSMNKKFVSFATGNPRHFPQSFCSLMLPGIPWSHSVAVSLWKEPGRCRCHRNDGASCQGMWWWLDHCKVQRDMTNAAIRTLGKRKPTLQRFTCWKTEERCRGQVVAIPGPGVFHWREMTRDAFILFEKYVCYSTFHPFTARQPCCLALEGWWACRTWRTLFGYPGTNYWGSLAASILLYPFFIVCMFHLFILAKQGHHPATNRQCSEASASNFPDEERFEPWREIWRETCWLLVHL